MLSNSPCCERSLGAIIPFMETFESRKARARQISRLLTRHYPDAHCALHFANPLQLLVATILSAQCTDKMVNRVTPALFARYPDAHSFAEADPKELQKLIQSTGFYRNKTRNIIQCCKQLVEHHGGEVPGTMKDLVRLAGIGRKTANVILGNAFHRAGIPVDTHVGRLSRRMGLTTETNPVKVERDLMELIPRRQWTMFSHRMIFHGRQVCKARKPLCETCPLASVCPRLGTPTEGAIQRSAS